MIELVFVFWDATVGYLRWLWGQLIFSTSDGLWGNYFYFLILVSMLFLVLEWYKPWRKGQPKIRRDFWLDAFYMFFNFFLFSAIAFAGLSEVGVRLFQQLLALIGITNLVAIEVSSWPDWLQIMILFVVKDFVEWWIHRLLHYSAWLWEFHKVHHSVKQMGFAAHLRFHWMESVLYKSIEYIPLAMIGFGLDDFFMAHAVAITIGHWNHANFKLNVGPLRYLINTPAMHIWHHAKNLPKEKAYGVNFGLSLSIWDYLFGTSYMPRDGRDEELGFTGDDEFPQDFWRQIRHGTKLKYRSK